MAQSLAPQQKATVEIAAINARAADVITKLRKLAPHPLIEAAIVELEKVRGVAARAHEKLTSLPASYSPHESKIAVKDIAVGSKVGIRETHQKKYVGVLTADEMTDLEVVAVGSSCGVQTRAGVRLVVPRGHLVTAPAKEEQTNAASE